MKPGQTLSLSIEKPAAGGRMIARVNGQVVLVSGAIPGERVLARIERVGKGVAYAETTAVEDASPDRRASAADPACGGCLYAHVAYPRQLQIKSAVIGDAFGRIGRLPLASPVAVAPSPEEGYRMRARLHVRGTRVGFYREGTHELCDPRRTRQLLPEALDALERVADRLASLGGNSARELILAENADASERVVHVEAAAPIDLATMDALGAVEGLTGLVSGFGTRGNAQVTDVISLDGTAVSLRRHVLAFFQGNRFLFRDLVAHAVAQIPAGARVIDLYSGGGAFAIGAAAARGARVTAVEGDRVSAGDLVANAARAGDGVTPVREAVETFLRGARSHPDLVIVDPPRTGLSREALDGVLRLRASRLVYVSCDVATLARDARRAVDAGYALDRADAFDLFPNTPHVETIVVFNRI